jgi:hypothetical protein
MRDTRVTTHQVIQVHLAKETHLLQVPVVDFFQIASINTSWLYACLYRLV